MKWLSHIWMTGLPRRTLIIWCCIVAAIGSILINARITRSLKFLSYDLVFWFGPKSSYSGDIVLVPTDSFAGDDETLDRSEQAEMIRDLAGAGAKFIVVDLIYRTPKDPQMDEELAEAMRDAGNVVLAAVLDTDSDDLATSRVTAAPLEVFKRASLTNGYVNLGPLDSPEVGRMIYHDPEYPNINKVVAGLMGQSGSEATNLWVRYHGVPERVFPKLNEMSDVNGKIAYVGDLSPGEGDEFVTPYGRFGREGPSPGVAIHATILANYLAAERGERWMTKMPRSLEIILCIVFGVGVTASLLHLRLDMALIASAVLMVVFPVVAMLLILGTGVWWSWLVPVMIQTPLALLAAAVVQVRTPRRARTRYDVFLSYRRDGGSETARLLQRELTAKKVRAFLDVVELGATEFGPQLTTVIAETPNFVIILTPGTLGRCQDPDDWVRQEIVEALKAGANIIPILKDGFQFPPEEELPEAIRRLPEFNGITYSHELFDSTLEKLVKFLR